MGRDRIVASYEEMLLLGQAVASTLSPGAILALSGDLGAGKTAFVQGLARALGVRDPSVVRSPTFTLIAEYEARIPLIHMDLYRLHSREELDGLGLEDYFDGEGITVVEWADRFPGIMPDRAITIHLEIVDETTRDIVVTGLP